MNWLNRATIPNVAGYKVELLFSDGTTKVTTVGVRCDGMHYLPNVDICNVKGWRPVR